MPKPGDIKEDDYGKLIWKRPEGCSEGWWSRIEDEDITESRTPFYCPCCVSVLDNWSNSYYNRWGVCSDCYFDFLDGRQDLPKMTSNSERISYCKQKREEKIAQK